VWRNDLHVLATRDGVGVHPYAIDTSRPRVELGLHTLPPDITNRIGEEPEDLVGASLQPHGEFNDASRIRHRSSTAR
jgi:hypothetical protein